MDLANPGGAPAPHRELTVAGLSPAIDRSIKVERLVPGVHAAGRRISRTPAGKATNVARVLGALGVKCRRRGFVGAGDQAWFEGGAGAGVDCSLVPVARGRHAGEPNVPFEK